MISSIEYKENLGFSKLFIDFINGSDFFDNRFPANKLIFDSKDKFSSKAFDFKYRNELIECIRLSMSNLDLSKNQSDNISKLVNRNSLTVITGQQVGFLGGPLYTFYKIRSAIEFSKVLSDHYSNLEFIPVFWIEDNDHDSQEASNISILTKNYEIKRISCDNYYNQTDRTPVSEKYFNSDINDIISEVISCLPETSYKKQIADFLIKIYNTDKNWSDAFSEIIQFFFADYGMLIVKASVARKQGLFNDLALTEISNIGRSNQLVENANKMIINKGYKLQAKSYDINLFLHLDNQRIKLEYDYNLNKIKINDKFLNIEEIRKDLETNHTILSPNVILRNVFQDNVLPNVAYIAGPSEIGYSAQITELYQFFNVDMPAFLPRHSATLIPQKIMKFIDEKKIEIDFFFRDFNEIEKDFTKVVVNSSLEKFIEDCSIRISDVLMSIHNQVIKMDANLEKTGLATEQKIKNELNNYHKKIIASQKRNNNLLYNKYKEYTNLLFPDNTLQERLFTPISFISHIGFELFQYNLKKLVSNNNKNHNLLVL